MENIDIELKELKKFRRNSSAMAGLIIGGAISLLMIVTDLIKDSKTVITIAGYLEFIIVSSGLYYFARKYVKKRGDFGSTFSHTLGFQMLTTLYASVLVGITSYVVMFIVSPDYYIGMYEEILKGNEEMFTAFKQMYLQLKDIPILVIIYSMITTFIKWFFPGMMIAVMLKNSNDPMQGFKKYMNQN